MEEKKVYTVKEVNKLLAKVSYESYMEGIKDAINQIKEAVANEGYYSPSVFGKIESDPAA